MRARPARRARPRAPPGGGAPFCAAQHQTAEGSGAVQACACWNGGRAQSQTMPAASQQHRLLTVSVPGVQPLGPRRPSDAGWTRGARARAGTIFKRFDAGKLFTLTCQDVAERFHLALSLLFVVVEEMDNAGSRAPNRALLQRCGAILAAEVAIDVTKHAVVTKFSDVRPGVYRQFLHVRARAARLGRRCRRAAPLRSRSAFLEPCPTFACPCLFRLPRPVTARGRAQAPMQGQSLLRATGAGRLATWCDSCIAARAQQPAKPLRHRRRPARRRGRRARRATQDVCEKTRGSQSHTAHRVVAFEPYAPAALFLRIAATYLGAHRAAAGAATGLSAPRALAGRAGWLGAAALAWAALFAAKAALGFWLRAAAVHLLRRAARRAR